MTEKPYTEEQISQALASTNGATRTLRRVILGLTIAVLVATTSTVILIVAVASQNRTTRQAAAVDACRSLFDNEVADARDVKADSLYDVVFELGRQLLESGASHPPTAFNPVPILAAVGKHDKAAADYVVEVKARDDWLKAGSPLPCPVKPEGT